MFIQKVILSLHHLKTTIMRKTILQTGVTVKEYLTYDFGYKHIFKVKAPYLKTYPLCDGTILEYLETTIKETL